jgi:hypothetical protein
MAEAGWIQMCRSAIAESDKAEESSDKSKMLKCVSTELVNWPIYTRPLDRSPDPVLRE